MDIKQEYLKELIKDQEFNSGDTQAKLNVMSKIGMDLNQRPYSDNIGKYETYHNFMNREDIGTDLNQRPYSDIIGKYQTYHDFMNRKDLDLNQRPYSDIIGKYQTYHDFMNRKDLDLNQLYEQSPRYVQNNITPNMGDGDIIPEHIINNQQDGDAITDNAIDFINQHPYVAATAGIAGLGALGYGIRKATKRMPVKTASWEDGFTEHELEKIANNVSRIGATIPIKKNWLGQVTRYGISPGVVNNVK